MCSTCGQARKQPLNQALKLIAKRMKDKDARFFPCLDETLDHLLGTGGNGQDALDQGTESLRGQP